MDELAHDIPAGRVGKRELVRARTSPPNGSSSVTAWPYAAVAESFFSNTSRGTARLGPILSRLDRQAFGILGARDRARPQSWPTGSVPSLRRSTVRNRASGLCAAGSLMGPGYRQRRVYGCSDDRACAVTQPALRRRRGASDVARVPASRRRGRGADPVRRPHVVESEYQKRHA